MLIQSANLSFYRFLLILVISCCSGCSGGSSSSVSLDQSASYSGKTTQATISADNANAFVTFLFGEEPPAPPVQTLAKIVPNKISRPTISAKSIIFLNKQLLNDFSAKKPKSSRKGQLLAKQTSNTLNGDVSGKMTYSGDLSANGTGSINFMFSNYDNGDGTIYDGGAVFDIEGYDVNNRIVTDGTIIMQKLTMRSSTATYSMFGTISTKRDTDKFSEIETYNVSVLNDSTHDAFKIENYSIKRTYDNMNSPTKCSELSSGRIYLQSHGYVDVNQDNPFIYNRFDQFNVVPESGGPLLVTGTGGTKVSITPISSTQFRTEVDTNGDDNYELSFNRYWTEVPGVVFKFEAAISGGGNSNYDSVAATSDGGYIAAGFTNTIFGTNNTNTRDSLVKTNAAGEVEWEKTFGDTTSRLSRLNCPVLETSDKGFIIAGYIYPSNYSYPFGYGGEQIYLIRTDSSGNTLWERTFSESSQWVYSIKQTTDGGFILMGGITPYSRKIYLLKISGSGDKVWDNALGDDSKVGYSMTIDSDGGYVVAGYTSAGSYNSIYLFKTDSSGNFLWQKTIGKTFDARAYSIIKASSGGYLIAGIANNAGYLAKIDTSGNILWEKTLNNTSHIRSATETPDGSLILAANLLNISGICLIKTDAQGVPMWQKNFSELEYGYGLSNYSSVSLIVGLDSGYVITGQKSTLLQNTNQTVTYFIKADKYGNTQ